MAHRLYTRALLLGVFLGLLQGFIARRAHGQETLRALPPPVLLAPADTARVLLARPEFFWRSVDSGSAYVFQVARDSAFTILTLTDSAWTDASLVPARPLMNDVTFFWRVGVRDSTCSCFFALLRSFPVAPAPALSPADLFFGFVPRGDPPRATTVIRDLLPFAISFDSIRSQTGLFRAVTPLPAIVDSLDSLALTISFAPREFLVMVDSMRLCTTLGEHVLRATGDSPPPLCMAATDSVDFRAVAIGDTCSATLVVHNRGVINSLRVTRLVHRSRAFRIRTPVPLTIPARDSTRIPVGFMPGALRPSSFGSFADTLTIESDGGRAVVRLAGESPPPRLGVLPGSYNFGEIAMRDSVIGRVRLANASVTGLRIDSVRTRTPAFSVGLLRGLLRVCDTMLVPIRFLPLEYGMTWDSLQVFSNAPGSPDRIPLTGTVPPSLPVTDTKAMEFGEIPSGEAGRRVLGISNNSLSPLAIDSVTTGRGCSA